jgi:hypothetical protein
MEELKREEKIDIIGGRILKKTEKCIDLARLLYSKPEDQQVMESAAANFMFIPIENVELLITKFQKSQERRNGMLPNTKIVIKKDGSTTIEGLENTDQCFKLSDLGKKAGKVVEDNPKDHTPVYQTVSMKGA